MNSSNAMPESSLDARENAPTVELATRPFYWSVRRELWENRSVYVAPLAGAGVYLFAFAISLMMRKAHAVLVPYDFAAGLMMAIALVVGVFYSLEALHGERRDRSILFWKSLPVSDVTTVLSKASIPLVILPMLTVAITVATQFITLLLNSAVLAGSHMSVAAYWTQVSLLQMSMGLFYHLFTVHVLLHAPFYCWFLLVSAWARRAAFCGRSCRRSRLEWWRRSRSTQPISPTCCWRNCRAGRRPCRWWDGCRSIRGCNLLRVIFC